MAFSWPQACKACAFDMAIFGFLSGEKKRNSSHHCRTWQPLCPGSPPYPSPHTAPLGWRRPTLEYFSPPATPYYPHALRRIGRPHPLACLFLWRWENGGINEASIRHASRVWGGGRGRGSSPIQECLRKLQEPPQPPRVEASHRLLFGPH